MTGLSGYPLEARLAESKSGSPMVTVGDSKPFPARNLSGIPTRKLIDPDSIGRTVVLSALSNNPDQPVITGVEESLLDDVLAAGPQPGGDPPVLRAALDGKMISLSADHTIDLRCGDAHITLRSNGTIDIRGNDLLIVSRGLNRIQGGILKLN
jgi:hypothetical protein